VSRVSGLLLISLLGEHTLTILLFLIDFISSQSICSTTVPANKVAEHDGAVCCKNCYASVSPFSFPREFDPFLFLFS